MKEYTHLTQDERRELFLMKQENMSNRAMAARLGRHNSTVSRELKRNVADARIGYLPDTADKMATERKAKPTPKLVRNLELQRTVIDQLKDGWSPEIIAGKLRLQSSTLRVSCETIYQFVYSIEGKKHALFKHLLKARPQRGKLQGRTPRNAIPERTSIHDRPADIATRKKFGHLEADLTFFVKNLSMNIGIMIERKTRFVHLILNYSKHSATVIKNMFNQLATLPAEARKSVTFDNGVEFTRHTLLKYKLKMNTYFCDKHSPWQKGQVEQANVMLHRYLPKTSDITKLSQEELNVIQGKLNNRPRKCLGFRTPAELFQEELFQCVALRT